MSSIPGVSTRNPTSTGQGFNALSSEDFVRIMTSELANQDPLAPNDSKAMLEQIASIRNIESNLALKKSLESLVKQNEFAAAGGLIGREVVGVDDEGAPVRGEVRSVANTSDGAVLNLEQGLSIRMKNLLQILSGDAQDAASGADSASNALTGGAAAGAGAMQGAGAL